MRTKGLKRTLASFIGISMIFPPFTSAEASTRLEFSSQAKNFNASYVIQQSNAGSSGTLSPGKTEVVINLSKILAQFETTIRFIHDDENGNEIPDVCKVSPQPGTGVPGLDLRGGNGNLFNIGAGIEISDQPDFNRDESETYFQVYFNVPLNSAGKDYLDQRYEEAVLVWDKSTERFLTSKHINRLAGGGFSLSPMAFEIKNSNKLYIKTSAEFTQEIGQPICPKKKVMGWGNSHSISSIERVNELDVSKMLQVIQYSKPSDVLLTNKVTRIKFASTASLPVSSVESDSNICIVEKDLVYLLKTGKCTITLSQLGNVEYEKATDQVLSFMVTGPSQSLKITCVKGKVTKIVSGVNPTCPSGFRRK